MHFETSQSSRIWQNIDTSKDFFLCNYSPTWKQKICEFFSLKKGLTFRLLDILHPAAMPVNRFNGFEAFDVRWWNNIKNILTFVLRKKKTVLKFRWFWNPNFKLSTHRIWPFGFCRISFLVFTLIFITRMGLLKRRGSRFVFQIMKFGIVIFFNLAPTGKK